MSTTWRVANSFSCLGSLTTFSISISGVFSIWRMDALTFDAEGQVVILWSAFPHIAHRLFSCCQFTSSGFSLPLGPSNCLCGWGGCWLFCQLNLVGCFDVWVALVVFMI